MGAREAERETQDEKELEKYKFIELKYMLKKNRWSKAMAINKHKTKMPENWM